MSHGQGKFASSLTGAVVVFRQRLRGRRRYDGIAVGSLIIGVIVLAAAFRILVFGSPTGHGNALRDTLRQWLSPGAMAATLLLMTSAAVLGAASAPTGASEEEIQSSLLAGLGAFALCTGRFLAAMWVPGAVLALSCLLWTAAEIKLQVIPAAEGGLGAVLLAHGTLFCATLMIGAVSFLCELRRTPTRSWGRGTAVGLLMTGILVAGPFLINRRIQTMEDPTQLIERTLVINPVSAVEAALGRDILHARWVYEHTGAADYLMTYPPPATSAGIFLTVALIAHALSVLRLRLAYR